MKRVGRSDRNNERAELNFRKVVSARGGVTRRPDDWSVFIRIGDAIPGSLIGGRRNEIRDDELKEVLCASNELFAADVESYRSRGIQPADPHNRWGTHE